MQKLLGFGLWLEKGQPRLECNNSMRLINRDDALTLRPCVLN